MPDRQHFTAEFKAESDAPFPILTDIDKRPFAKRAVAASRQRKKI
jgi:hypothetical protein